jgi:hypothetical protein
LKEKLLDIYSDYLISQNKHATATGLSELLSGELSHDQITRFLHSGEYGSKELWQYVKGLVRQQEGIDEGVLIIDDTVEEKAYTDENEVMCWHYSYAKGRHVKGINLLSSLIRYGDISVPVSYEIIKKDIRFCDVETRSEKRKSSINKNELFRKLVKQAISNDIKFSYVLADNWFSSKETVKFIHYELSKYFILGIKSNRTVATSLEGRQKGDFKRIESLNIQDNTALTVWLKEVDFPVKLLKKIFTNENGSIGILYLITNDLSLESTRFYDIYQKRWRIEEYHKSIKQNASLAKSPTKVIRSQCNHIFSTLIAYCKLEKLN